MGSTSWKHDTWLCIDCETTGLDPAKDRIVELGAVESPGRCQTLRRDIWLVNPGIPIPPEATAVHGITDEMVREAPPLADVVAPLLRLVARADVLVGYHWPFDASFLAAWVGRAWLDAIKGKPIIDPLVVARLDDVGRFWCGQGQHKLGAVAERLGVRISADAHRVAANCEMTLGVLQKLLDHLPDSADEASKLIRTNREKQDANFRAFLARQRKR